MSWADLFRLDRLVRSTRDWIKAAAAGTAIELPTLSGVRLFGRKGRLIMIYDVEE